MAKYNLIALTNPLEGRDDEFNDWYTNVHLADVLKLPGVTGGAALSPAERSIALARWTGNTWPSMRSRSTTFRGRSRR